MSTQPTITFDNLRPEYATGTAIDDVGAYTFAVASDGSFVNLHRDGRTVRRDHKRALHAAVLDAYRHATRGRDLGAQHDAHLTTRRDHALILDCLRVRDLGGPWLDHASFDLVQNREMVTASLVRDGLAAWDEFGIHITPRGRRAWWEQRDAHMRRRATSAALDLVTFDPAPIARPATLPTMLRAAYAFHRRQCWGLFNGWPCRASEALAQARIDVERGIFRALPQVSASCAR